MILHLQPLPVSSERDLPRSNRINIRKREVFLQWTNKLVRLFTSTGDSTKSRVRGKCALSHLMLYPGVWSRVMQKNLIVIRVTATGESATVQSWPKHKPCTREIECERPRSLDKADFLPSSCWRMIVPVGHIRLPRLLIHVWVINRFRTPSGYHACVYPGYKHRNE